MSRIFDALRRAERERAGKSAGVTAGDEPRWHELTTPLEGLSESLKRVQPLVCRLSPDDHIVLPSQNRNFGVEKFWMLRHLLQQLRGDRAMHKLLITSSIPKEGKTLVAVNLATTLAIASSRVLFIDADMRNPVAHRPLGHPSLPGLADVLEGRAELLAALRRADPLGFYYLAAGHATTNPVELLQGPKLRELMAQVTALFDWVVLDSPPLSVFADAHCLASVADAVLFVVRSGLTTPESLQEGLKGLAGAHLAGVVMNASEEADRDGYYSAYRSSSASATNKTPGPWASKAETEKPVTHG